MQLLTRTEPVNRKTPDVDYHIPHSKDFNLINSTPGAPMIDPWVHPGLRLHGYSQITQPANFREKSNVDTLKISGECGTWEFCQDQTDGDVFEAIERLDSVHEYPEMMILCVKLESDDEALFDHKVSLSAGLTRELWDRFQIHSGYLMDVLARPNYWSSVFRIKQDGLGDALEFYCQHPRWHQKGRYDKAQSHATKGNKAPCSVYMHHSPSRNLTLYIVAAPEDGEWFDFLNQIQLGKEQQDDPKVSTYDLARSPFMLHALINGIAFEQSTEYLSDIRIKLMGQLRKINFDEEPGNKIPSRAVNTLRDMEGRFELEALTIHLNSISQMINTGLSSVFSSIQLSRNLIEAHRRYYAMTGDQNSGGPVNHTQMMLEYLRDAFHCQENYLRSYNLRKETAMNFVFHIVTQQDSATNLKVSSRMAGDSSSMNTITVLTMLFLPGTFTATVFSSVAFRAADSGAAEVTQYVWPFLAVSIALTCSVIGFWYWTKRARKVKESQEYSV